MGPEIWIVVAAVFVSGGAIGSAGTLLAQWLIRKMDAGTPPADTLDSTERKALRAEVADLHRQFRNMDARLEFTERLLDGALPLTRPPERIQPSDPILADEPGVGADDPGTSEAGRDPGTA